MSNDQSYKETIEKNGSLALTILNACTTATDPRRSENELQRQGKQEFVKKVNGYDNKMDIYKK